MPFTCCEFTEGFPITCALLGLFPLPNGVEAAALNCSGGGKKKIKLA
jgi:hypothetical protein